MRFFSGDFAARYVGLPESIHWLVVEIIVRSFAAIFWMVIPNNIFEMGDGLKPLKVHAPYPQRRACDWLRLNVQCTYPWHPFMASTEGLHTFVLHKHLNLNAFQLPSGKLT